MHSTLKKKIGSALGGAVAAGALPFSVGISDWKVAAGAAAVGAIGGFFGVDVAGKVRQAVSRPGASSRLP